MEIVKRNSEQFLASLPTCFQGHTLINNTLKSSANTSDAACLMHRPHGLAEHCCSPIELMREVNDLYCRSRQDVDLGLNIYSGAHLLQHEHLHVQGYCRKDQLYNSKQVSWKFQ